jgi:hypothetical protein
MPNATHRKRLARLYAARAGITYMAALRAVADAANHDRLPSRLDEAGMQAALRILSSQSPDTSTADSTAVAATVAPDADAPIRKTASDPRDQRIFDLSFQYETLTGEQGLLYIASPGGKADKYVFGGGFVALGRKEALDHIETLVADASLLRGGGERYYLIPEALRLLRKVWQGRVNLTSTGWKNTDTRFTIDDKNASDINELHLMWLRKHRYFEANLSPGEEWAVARTTDFGDEVLARNGADTDKFHDGLPKPSTGPNVKILKHSDIQRCPVRSLSAEHYNADGTCKCPPEVKQASIDISDGLGASDDANPYQNFNTSGTVTADVRGLLNVQQVLADAGRVEWWWHRGPFKGLHGFKTVEGVNADGDLVLVDEDPNQMQQRTTLSLDYIDDPDKAARHLIWPEDSGVTFRDKATGEIDATYRVAGPKPEPSAKSPGVRRVVRRPVNPVEDRIDGWVKTQTNADPSPAGWSWVDPDGTKKATDEIEVVYSDGTKSIIRPGTLPDANTILNPAVDRLMGGPTTTKVYDTHDRRVNATCDVCNRRLATKEPWWMVHSPDRGWENNAGVVCGMHHPDRLPLHTVGDDTTNDTLTETTAANSSALDFEHTDEEYETARAAGHKAFDLHLVEDDRDDPRTNADRVARAAAATVHAARPDERGTHCAVCLQRVRKVPGGQGTTWVHSESGAVAAAGGDPQHPLNQQ